MKYTTTLFVSLLCAPLLPVAHAATDLIDNSNFDTGNTSGWSSINVSVYRTVGRSKELTRAAQVGDVLMSPRSDIAPAYISANSVTGILSQTVRIPFGSRVHLEFSYIVISNQPHLFGKAGLEAYLLRNDGSTIAQWSGVRDSEWHVVAYDLGPSLEEQLTIKFVGRGDAVGYTSHDEPIIAIAYVDDVHMTATPLMEWLPVYALPVVVGLVAIIMVKFGREPEASTSLNDREAMA